MKVLRSTLCLLGLAHLASACVESRELPLIPAQAEVQYGERLYVKDNTLGSPPSGDVCTDFVPVSTTTVGIDFDPLVPANCFVILEPAEPRAQRTLRVDRVEVTNELFQICVDSGACQQPDPAKFSASQVCQVAEEFDTCPVVEVPQLEAQNFCRWIGRRLPSSFEHLVMRQANLTAEQRQDPTLIPDYVFADGMTVPSPCDDAVLGTAGCMASRPRPVLDSNFEPVGAAPRDVAEGNEQQTIFDLTGNVSEWTSDLFPARRGNENDLPWFCVASLARTSTSGFSAANPPACPEGARCVYGQYQPGEDLPLGVYPVCITSESGRFDGVAGALFGGSHNDDDPSPESVGIYARKVDPEPQQLTDTSRARGYGFRCVGDRDSGTREGDDVTLPAFDDRFTLGRLSSTQ